MVGGISNSKTNNSEEGRELGREIRRRDQVNEYQEDTTMGYTMDESLDYKGNPALKHKSGGWVAGIILLVNQGLVTLAFFGVNVNLVLFLTRVMQQDNAAASNNVSKWTGAVYTFSLIGAFLSDSYWGRFKTCTIFQAIFVVGLVMLSLVTQMLLIKPSGCGTEQFPCTPHSKVVVGLFYLSIYMVALGNGGYQPNIATFGADQFDKEDPVESHSKVAFFSYFYLALNGGSLFSNSVLSYYEDRGMWTMGFSVSAICAIIGMVLFFVATPKYRNFKPSGNPISRVSQVVVAASRKWKLKVPPGGDGLCESVRNKLQEEADDNDNKSKMVHTEGFKFLDKAALMDSMDLNSEAQSGPRNPWRLCTVTQVEEVKCVLRLLPIWLCTIPYSVVFTQMASTFVVQGAAMYTRVGNFSIAPSSMSVFDILSVAVTIFLIRRVLNPIASKIMKSPNGLTEIHRMGIGLVIAAFSMVASGVVEHFRLQRAMTMPPCEGCQDEQEGSSLHIMWQLPQYVLIGSSEVFMYVGQLEFFNDQAPDGLKTFGSALCMMSIALGNFFSDFIVEAVMKATTTGNQPGWIPANLNHGHLDKFYYLLAAMVGVDLVLFVLCAKWYKSRDTRKQVKIEISRV